MCPRPLRTHNPAISALRYLLSRIDARGLRVPKPEDAEKPKPLSCCHWLNDALRFSR
jgi:hypothetical protein